MIPDWGFYAHRKINYFAVLTIPPPLNQFYKSHIAFIREHAVDPDQRRYAVPAEGSRHFIDLDRWAPGDSCVLTKDYTMDRILQGGWKWETKDSTMVLEPVLTYRGRVAFAGPGLSFTVDSFALRQEIYLAGTDSAYLIPPFLYPDSPGYLYFNDSLTAHGIVPYYIVTLFERLVRQMQERDLESVVRISTDIGHYISDAHVPLHTTSNYNGQFTNQLGIHAFWESRIPELFEETYFNSLVGRARYIEDVHEFIWNIVNHSYRLVPVVLEKELEARLNIAGQHHYCYEERGNQLVRTPCPILAKEYMNLMDGMVQQQWTSAIAAVGSVWYTAWMDAGQPTLWNQTVPRLADTSMIDRILGVFRKSNGDKRTDLH